MKALSKALEAHERPRARAGDAWPGGRDRSPQALTLMRVTMMAVGPLVGEPREVVDVTGEVVPRPASEPPPVVGQLAANVLPLPPPPAVVAARYLAHAPSRPPVTGRSVYA